MQAPAAAGAAGSGDAPAQLPNALDAEMDMEMDDLLGASGAHPSQGPFVIPFPGAPGSAFDTAAGTAGAGSVSGDHPGAGSGAPGVGEGGCLGAAERWQQVAMQIGQEAKKAMLARVNFPSACTIAHGRGT